MSNFLVRPKRTGREEKLLHKKGSEGEIQGPGRFIT